MTTPARLTVRQIVDGLGPKARFAVPLCGVLAFAASALRQDFLAALLCACLGAAAAAIVIIDLRQFRIADLLSSPLIPLGLAYAALMQPILPRLVAMALISVGLELLRWGFRHWRGASGLGSGDVKLMTAAAAWLPPEVIPLYLLSACLSGLLTALASRTNHRNVIAFGAHLAPWLVGFVLLG